MNNQISFDIGTKFGSPFGKTLFVGNLVSVIVTNSFVIAGVLILFFLILGGFYIITGAGGQNPENVAKGRQAATSAAIGFIIVFVAYWIIRIIELITGVDFITAPGL